MKGAFKEASKDTGRQASVQQTEQLLQSAKKKIKLGGPLCNAASSCSSKAVYKIDSTKRMYCKEHFDLVLKPARKGAVKIEK